MAKHSFNQKREIAATNETNRLRNKAKRYHVQRNPYSHLIERMTNWQRGQFAKAGYPQKDLGKIEAILALDRNTARGIRGRLHAKAVPGR